MDSNSLVDWPDFALNLVRAVRQGLFFGAETRIPYAVTSLIRPYLFGKQPRPLRESVKFYAQQTLEHGWIIAKIAVLFKVSERVLARASRAGSVQEWHTFVAGALAGYTVMCADRTNASLKRQINMAIGVRTLYALGSYLVRVGRVPLLEDTAPSYARGNAAWVTLMWGVVMWHWRHFSVSQPGEMVESQARQMDFIYTAGDAAGSQGWTSNYYLLWLAALAAARRVL